MNFTGAILLTTLISVSDDGRFDKTVEIKRQWNTQSTMEMCEKSAETWKKSYEGVNVNGITFKAVATCIER